MPMLNRPPRSEMQAATPQTRIGVVCSERAGDPLLIAEGAAQQASSRTRTGLSSTARMMIAPRSQREQDRERLTGERDEPVGHHATSAIDGEPARPDAGHHEAKLFLADALAVEIAHDPAGEHHEDAVGKRHQLVELDGDQEDGPAFGALAHDLAMDRLGARRCRRRASADRSSRKRASPENSRASTTFWMLPPESLFTGDSGPRARISKRLISAFV